MVTRFDNLPTDELLRAELQMRLDRRALLSLVNSRFRALAEERFTFGKAYKVARGRFADRFIILEYVVAGGTQFGAVQDEMFPLAEGRLSFTGKQLKWTRKTQQVRLDALDPTTGFDPHLKGN